MLKKFFNKKATIAAVVASYPFVLLASYFWWNAPIFPGGSFEAYWYGDQIYKLGLPLTGIIIFLPKYTGVFYSRGDDWWLIPIADVLFIIQWVCWSNLAAFLLSKIRGLFGK